MTILDVHQCFHCELRFATLAELHDHLSIDHDVGPDNVSRETRQLETSGSIVVAVSPMERPSYALSAVTTIATQARMVIEVASVDELGLADLALDRHLSEAAQQAKRAGATATAVRLPSAPDASVASILLEHLARSGPTFVALGTRTRGALPELVLGSVSAEIVQRSPIPVLLTRPGVELSRVARVLVCLDGSALAERSVPVAQDVARRLGAGLCLVTVVDPSRVPADVVESAYVRAVADGLRAGVDRVDFDTLHHDRPAAAIVDYADNETLVVMTTHGHKGLRRRVVGGVAHAVVHGAPCPVLMVGPGVD